MEDQSVISRASRTSARRVSPVAAYSGEGLLLQATADAQPPRWGPPFMVESECGAVALGRTYLLPPLSSGGASLVRPWLRFHTPLIEPDMQICRIRLSDTTSRLHPRRAATKPCEAYEPKVPVKVREWIAPALRRLTLCLNRSHRRNRTAV